MSNVNIRRAVENIRATTTVYTPIVETVVNAIESIDAAQLADGLVRVTLHRSPQSETDDTESRILDVSVEDNGIGFTQANRDSFDTLYSDHKLKQGGKGFGRFICLKYFDDLHVDSVFVDEKAYRRQFSMGKGQDIIVNEMITESDRSATGTKVMLSYERGSLLPRKLSTIARGIVEVLLPYFTTEGYTCPKIELREKDDSETVVLNDYLSGPNASIREVALSDNQFILDDAKSPRLFRVRVFRMYYPRNKVSKISLVAHKREVIETSLQDYIPEFAEEFLEPGASSDARPRNYILRSYVFGDYLDENVLLERGAFAFKKETDLFYGISQNDIERRVAEITRAAVADHVISRQEQKKERIESYVEESAPWHKTLLRSIDLSSFSMTPTDAEIEAVLHKEKFRQEVKTRSEVASLLTSSNSNELKAKVAAVATRISESSKNELVHYVALRRQVLEIFKRSLELDPDGTYSSEGALHDVIFPRKSDSETRDYEEHNLWILDERLTFTRYVTSDLPIEGGVTSRPDLLAFDRRVAFRSDNETSNPVIVFEFKKPGRDDFVNPSSREDPVQQIIRYVNSIRDGKFLTPKGRKINVAPTTPFYGYVVCDLTPKIEKWLETEKNFTPMPDRLGWFDWFSNINLYVEVLSWDKVVKDADMRNRIFFHKLGIL